MSLYSVHVRFTADDDSAGLYNVEIEVWQDAEGNGPGYLALVALGVKEKS